MMRTSTTWARSRACDQATGYCSDAAPSIELTAGAVDSIRSNLAKWYAESRRKLPWRGDDTLVPRSAYGTWVSEVMLQQTRVETVIAYWNRWMAEFPDVASLAAASPEDVNRLWAGLGYYRRAQMLLQGAKKVVNDFGGVMPETVPELLSVPGIGPYTAGAIASIAFGKAEPLVDGNVMRVFSRLFAMKLEVGGGAMEKACWALAKQLVPAENPGDFNQALMELGATVCKPTSPSCSSCPIRDSCQGLSLTTLAKEIDTLRQKRTMGVDGGSNTAAAKGYVTKGWMGTLDLFVRGGKPQSSNAEVNSERALESAAVDIEDTAWVDALPFDPTLLPRDVCEFPRKVAKKKAKELTFSVCVLRTKHVLTGNHSSDGVKNEVVKAENIVDSEQEYRYLFVRRPATGLLANQWEFPSLELAATVGTSLEDTEDGVEYSEPNAVNAAVRPTQSELWSPFQNYFSEKLCLAYDANTSSAVSETTTSSSGAGASMLEIATRSDFEPIVHVFSHQRHTMHVTLRDVVVLGGNGDAPSHSHSHSHSASTSPAPVAAPVAYQWMTAAEIVAAGITTGCKKVLTEVTKVKAESCVAKTKATPAKRKASTAEKSAHKTECGEPITASEATSAAPRNAFDLLRCPDDKPIADKKGNIKKVRK